MASQAFPAQGGNTFKQRPYSVAVPAFSQVSFSHRLLPLRGDVSGMGDAEQIPGHSPCCGGWDGMSGSAPVLRMRGGAEGGSPTSVRCFRTT